MGVDTLKSLSFVTPASAGEEDLASRSALGAVATMAVSVVVPAQAAIQSRLLGSHGGEEPAAEFDRPELAEEGALQSLDQAVGPLAWLQGRQAWRRRARV